MTDPKAHITDFTPIVLASIHALPDAVAQHHVRSAAIELARRTKTLKRMTYAHIGSGKSTGTIDPLRSEDCVTPFEVCEVQHPRCAKLNPVRCINDVECIPQSYYVEFPHIHVSPQASYDCPDVLEIVLSVCPKRDACEFDAVLYDKYADEIAHRAVGLALDMPSADWYNPSGAEVARRRWERFLAHASAVETRGGMSGPLRPRTVRFV